MVLNYRKYDFNEPFDVCRFSRGVETRFYARTQTRVFGFENGRVLGYLDTQVAFPTG